PSSWGWNDAPLPRGSAKKPQQPTDIADAWYPGDDPTAQDQWAPAGDGAGEQYPYAEEGAYGYAPSAPPPLPPGEGQQEWEENVGVASGGRISSSRSRARRRGKKRG
ncbi:unnamed protein product, partial [Scytosiphon promiscuus]